MTATWAGVMGAADPLPELPMWSEAWWSAFTRSAGFGGVAAVVAAFVAFLGVVAKSVADGFLARRARRDTLDDAAAERWWEMYRWSLAQIDSLTVDQAYALLDELNDQAPGPAEQGLVLVAIEMYTAKEAS